MQAVGRWVLRRRFPLLRGYVQQKCALRQLRISLDASAFVKVLRLDCRHFRREVLWWILIRDILQYSFSLPSSVCLCCLAAISSPSSTSRGVSSSTRGIGLHFNHSHAVLLLLCRQADGRWGPNTKMFVNAVGMHPDRLTNMYFAYIFVLRAVGKARPFLMVRYFVVFEAREKAERSYAWERITLRVSTVEGGSIR